MGAMPALVSWNEGEIADIFSRDRAQNNQRRNLGLVVEPPRRFRRQA